MLGPASTSRVYKQSSWASGMSCPHEQVKAIFGPGLDADFKYEINNDNNGGFSVSLRAACVLYIHFSD